MATPASSISVHVKLTVDPSKVDDFFAAFKPTFERVTAEPLNTFFEIYRDEKTPGVYKLIEDWNVSAEYMLGVS
jgi:quinol monooxygenase YgiN